MPTKILRHEFYDESGLIEVREYEVEDTTEQDIADRESLLLQIYNEIQELKNKQN
jgi:DNA-binding MltR family transcriptional regulator